MANDDALGKVIRYTAEVVLEKGADIPFKNLELSSGGLRDSVTGQLVALATPASRGAPKGSAGAGPLLAAGAVGVAAATVVAIGIANRQAIREKLRAAKEHLSSESEDEQNQNTAERIYDPRIDYQSK